MEASVLEHAGSAPLRGSTPLLRIAGDERLVALTRRGNQAAFETLVARYQARLLAFCRHMVGTREDAEDVLQEVFAASYNAMIADERPINVRPWLYRIARNRSLNHLRRTQAIGVDSMDVHVAEHGTTTDEKVHKREEFRQLMADVRTLPETQRTALLLREIDALSYEQIAEAMETTIPSIKSLLVRARVSLAEASEARALTCEDVRDELGEVAEGIKQRLSPPARRHVRECESCAGFRKQIRSTNKALAALFPIGPLLLVKKAALAHLGTTAGATSTVAASGAAAGGGGASLVSAGVTAVAGKTAAGLAAVALVGAGAVEVRQASRHQVTAPVPTVSAPAPRSDYAAPAVVVQQSQPAGTVDDQLVGGAVAPSAEELAKAVDTSPSAGAVAAPDAAAATPDPAVATDPTATADTPWTPPVEQGADSTVLPAGSAAGGAPVPTPPVQTPVTPDPALAAAPPVDVPQTPADAVPVDPAVTVADVPPVDVPAVPDVPPVDVPAVPETPVSDGSVPVVEPPASEPPATDEPSPVTDEPVADDPPAGATGSPDGDGTEPPATSEEPAAGDEAAAP